MTLSVMPNNPIHMMIYPNSSDNVEKSILTIYLNWFIKKLKKIYLVAQIIYNYQQQLNMEYQVEIKCENHIEIQLTHQSGLKINWILSDYTSYPAYEWFDLLDYMKGTKTNNKSPSIRCGYNSYWSADVQNSKFRLKFDITESGGDSLIIHEFPIEQMIPVVEQIIEKILLLE